MNRVVLSPSALMPADKICRPYSPAVSALAMAATLGSFSSATWRAASAVLPQVDVLKPCCCTKTLLWASACGWLMTVLTVSSVAPGTPSRSCRIGRSHIRAMIISGWVYSRSSTVETSPALEFSNGRTPNCASPFCTASKTSPQVVQAVSRAKGKRRRSAMWLHAPGTPW